METFETITAQLRQTYFTEELLKNLIETGDPRVLDFLCSELEATRALMKYPSYEGEWRHLSDEERKAYGARRHAWTMNWFKRHTLVDVLGELGDPRALPHLEKNLDETMDYDMWGTGVGVSIAQFAQHAIQKIKDRGLADDLVDDE